MEVTFFADSSFDWNAVSAIANLVLAGAAIFGGVMAWRDLKSRNAEQDAHIARLDDQVSLASLALKAQRAAFIKLDVLPAVAADVPPSAHLEIPRLPSRAAVIYENLGTGFARDVTVRIWVQGYERLPDAFPTQIELDRLGPPHWISDKRFVPAGGTEYPHLVFNNEVVPPYASAPRMQLLWETTWRDAGGESDFLIGGSAFY